MRTFGWTQNNNHVDAGENSGEQIKPTVLYPTNGRAAAMNERELAKLTSPECRFQAYDEVLLDSKFIKRLANKCGIKPSDCKDIGMDFSSFADKASGAQRGGDSGPGVPPTTVKQMMLPYCSLAFSLSLAPAVSPSLLSLSLSRSLSLSLALTLSLPLSLPPSFSRLLPSPPALPPCLGARIHLCVILAFQRF